MARSGRPPESEIGVRAGEPSARTTAILILVLTALAAVLRLVWLDRSPPGLNQDEAINAWNAQCLLETGRDMVGARWPVFYAHAIGDNRTTLLIYWLIPFQALGGLGVVAMRSAAAVSGILCVPLMVAVGSRLFGRACGLVAAALLVANPWHFSSTRWAIDGSIVPFLTLATVALMLRAGLPIADGEPRPANPALAGLAGAVAGAACYGYWALRLHLPVFLALTALLTWHHRRARLRTRAGTLAALAFVVGLAVTFGPLVVRHFTDPGIAIRGAMTRLWEPGTPPVEIALRVLGRYALHFGPRFLFVRGDVDPGNAPADSGAFEWTMLPLMLIGLVAALRGSRGSASCALLLAMVLAYPAGDLVGRYDGVHAFRSSPGMVALVLLAALGATRGWRWMRGRSRALAWAAAVALLASTMLQDARSIATYFGAWRERPPVYFLFHADFMQACEYVRPRFPRADAVFWTTAGVNMPFAMTLVGLEYDPARWQRDPKDIRPGPGGWDYYVRYGKNYFLYGRECAPYVDSLRATGRRVHAIFVVRPHELGLERPSHIVRGPDGRELLWVCEGEL